MSRAAAGLDSAVHGSPAPVHRASLCAATTQPCPARRRPLHRRPNAPQRRRSIHRLRHPETTQTAPPDAPLESASSREEAAQSTTERALSPRSARASRAVAAACPSVVAPSTCCANSLSQIPALANEDKTASARRRSSSRPAPAANTSTHPPRVARSIRRNQLPSSAPPRVRPTRRASTTTAPPLKSPHRTLLDRRVWVQTHVFRCGDSE